MRVDRLLVTVAWQGGDAGPWVGTRARPPGERGTDGNGALHCNNGAEAEVPSIVISLFHLHGCPLSPLSHDPSIPSKYHNKFKCSARK